MILSVTMSNSEDVIGDVCGVKRIFSAGNGACGKSPSKFSRERCSSSEANEGMDLAASARVEYIDIA